MRTDLSFEKIVDTYTFVNSKYVFHVTYILSNRLGEGICSSLNFLCHDVYTMYCKTGLDHLRVLKLVH